MKKLVSILLAALLILGVFASCASAAEVTYKLGHMSPLDNNYNLLAERFKALVEEKSGGRIAIEIYPQAQLGYDRDLLEAMQFGTVDFAVNTASVISNFAPLLGALDLPYLLNDWDHIEKFIASDAATSLLGECESEGLVGLSLMGRGFRSVTNNVRPITSLEDIKGIKLRVVESTVFVKTFEDFGVVTSAMSFGEVFTALQQGAIDGQENPPETIFAERVYEVQKYLSLTQHIAGWAALMASKSTFDRMSAEDQQLIRECAVQAAFEETQINREKEGSFIEKLEAQGMQVNDLDRAPFKAAATSAYSWFEGTYGEAGMNYVNAIRETAK